MTDELKIGAKIEALKGSMTYEELSKDIFEKTGHEIHWTTLQKYATGKRNPSLKALEIISTYSGKPLSYFVNDASDNIRKKVSRLEKLKDLRDRHGELTKVIDIPILGEVPAGEPSNIEEYIEGYHPIPKAISKGEDFALRVRGDSMIDVGIEPGDLLLIRKQPVAEQGQTVIARIGDEITCKRFYLRHGRPVLEPANSRYKTIEPEELEIIGVVTRFIRELE